MAGSPCLRPSPVQSIPPADDGPGVGEALSSSDPWRARRAACDSRNRRADTVGSRPGSNRSARIGWRSAYLAHEHLAGMHEFRSGVQDQPQVPPNVSTIKDIGGPHG